MIAPQVSPIDDAALIDAIRSGDASACELLVSRFGPRMLSVASRFLRCPQDRDDALQEAFISAFRNLDQFKGGSMLSTWLHTVIVRVCLMKLRSRKRRAETSIDDLLPHFTSDGHRANPGAAWADSPEAHSQRQETRELVRQCIDQLPENYRTVLLLRDIEELDTETTAQMLNLSIAAVKVRLHRARLALRTLLDPHMTRDE